MIGKSQDPNDEKWIQAKTEMLSSIKEGIAINPHYRKITPMVADALAQWGDWKNATWIWESILESRPYVVALLTNAARGEIQAKNYYKAAEFLERAKSIQPRMPSVRTLEVTLLARSSHEAEAALLAHRMIEEGVSDADLLHTAYQLGMRLPDPELAIAALTLKIKLWPEHAAEENLKLAQIYDAPSTKNEEKAIHHFLAALDATPAPFKPDVLSAIPQKYRSYIK